MALTDWIKQMNQKGTTTAPVSTKKTPMELLIAQQAMAQKADANTMTGFALGKLLRGLFDDWKERYDARGLLNDVNALKDKNKQAEALANIEKTNPQQHQLMQDYINEDGSKWASLRQNPTEVSSINQNARAVQQAPTKLLGDTDFWSQRTTSEPWRDDENWNKWRNLFSGTGWQNGLRF